jgi:hypothetical protein
MMALPAMSDGEDAPITSLKFYRGDAAEFGVQGTPIVSSTENPDVTLTARRLHEIADTPPAEFAWRCFSEYEHPEAWPVGQNKTLSSCYCSH